MSSKYVGETHGGTLGQYWALKMMRFKFPARIFTFIHLSEVLIIRWIIKVISTILNIFVFPLKELDNFKETPKHKFVNFHLDHSFKRLYILHWK